MLPTLCLLFAAAPPPPDDGLAARLLPIINAHKGKVAVGMMHLPTRLAFYHNPDQVMPTASLIKVAVLIEAYTQAGEGKISLQEKITLKDSDKVPGSGILTNHFSEGATLPLRDCVRLMIAFSDNTATNLVIDKVGIENVNKRMKAWGLNETRLNAKVFRGSTTSVDKERTKKYGLGSTTAREMVSLFKQLTDGDRLKPAQKLAVLGHLSRNEDKDKFKRDLPEGTRVAHKDGSVTESRTDAGVIYTPKGAIILVVLTNGNADKRWARDNAGNDLCAKLARAVYDHYNQPRKGKQR